MKKLGRVATGNCTARSLIVNRGCNTLAAIGCMALLFACYACSDPETADQPCAEGSIELRTDPDVEGECAPLPDDCESADCSDPACAEALENACFNRNGTCQGSGDESVIICPD